MAGEKHCARQKSPDERSPWPITGSAQRSHSSPSPALQPRRDAMVMSKADSISLSFRLSSLTCNACTWATSC
jgi:hypothetical protein